MAIPTTPTDSWDVARAVMTTALEQAGFASLAARLGAAIDPTDAAARSAVDNAVVLTTPAVFAPDTDWTPMRRALATAHSLSGRYLECARAVARGDTHSVAQWARLFFWTAHHAGLVAHGEWCQSPAWHIGPHGILTGTPWCSVRASEIPV